jgi:hypothetical protein
MNHNQIALAVCTANSTGTVISIHAMKVYGEVYM